MTTTALLALADVLAATAGALATAPPSPAHFDSVSIDSRTIEAGALFVAIKGPRFDGHDFLAQVLARGARAALVERSVAAPAGLPLIRVADTVGALAALARHVRRQVTIPVVAITGSVGKTTTKEMAAHLLATAGSVLKTEGNLNNQFGLPLTLLRLRPEHTAAVLELGMSAPGEIRALAALALPTIATITRIAPVHLQFFPSLDAIAEAKAEIFESLSPPGTAVLNRDDPRVRAIAGRFHGRTVWFGRGADAEVSATHEEHTGAGASFELRTPAGSVAVRLPFAGPHFVNNFLAAAATSLVLGISPEAMARAAASLAPARHRGEVRRLAEVLLLDDCYNSSPDALEAAIATLVLLPGRRHVAILGDMLELGPTGPALHRERGRALPGRVDAVIGVGALASEIVDGAREAGLAPSQAHHFETAEEAAVAATSLVRAGDAVLVKGSRGVKLETVVDALARRFAEGEA